MVLKDSNPSEEPSGQKSGSILEASTSSVSKPVQSPVKLEKTSDKGQLNSEWIFEVIISPKIQTKNYKDFLPTKKTSIIAKIIACTHQKITKKCYDPRLFGVGYKPL